MTVYNKTTFNPGTAPGISAVKLNEIGNGIFDAYFQSGAMFHEAMVATPTYTGSNITQVNETVGGVLRRRTDLTYTVDNVSTVRVQIYGTDGTTVLKDYTDTYAYSGDNISSITRTVSV